jgi:hypothetical protein
MRPINELLRRSPSKRHRSLCLTWPVVQWGDTEIVVLCNSKDSAHIVANFDTLPSARKLLFIHEILGTKSLLCPQHVYQISKLEY